MLMYLVRVIEKWENCMFVTRIFLSTYYVIFFRIPQYGRRGSQTALFSLHWSQSNMHERCVESNGAIRPCWIRRQESQMSFQLWGSNQFTFCDHFVISQSENSHLPGRILHCGQTTDWEMQGSKKETVGARVSQFMQYTRTLDTTRPH